METSLISAQPNRIGPSTVIGGTNRGVATNEITLNEIWQVVRKRKLVILGCLLGTVLLAGLISAVLPRKYEAVARVLVNPQDSNALGINAMDAITGNGLTSDIVQQTQVRVLQSDTLAWDVIRQLRLDQRPDFAGDSASPANSTIESVPGPTRVLLVNQLHAAMRVEGVPKTQLIEVRFRARDPKLAADVVNALSNAYIERNFRTRYQATMQASDWMTKQLDDLKTNVEASQQRFAEYQKKSGIIGMDENDTHNVFLTQLDELNKALAGAEAERILREARYRVARSGNPELIAQVAPTSTLAVLRGQQADLKNQYAQLTAKYGNAYPRVVQVRAQVAQVESSIDEQVKVVREQLQKEYEAAAKNEQMLSAELERHKQEAYKMNEAGIQYAILKRESESSRDLYEDLLKKLKEAGIVAGLHSTNIDVIDPAEVPIKPAEPRPALNLAIGFLLGAFGGIGMAFLLESMDTTISTPEHAEVLANMPVLGVVPHISLNGRNGHKQIADGQETLPAVLRHPNSEFSEAMRALRTTLLLSSAGAPPKVIVITSAVPGDGKTTMALNCAVVLAHKNKRVLLLDADLRRSGVRGQLGLNSTSGLSSCLAGVAEPKDVIQPLAEATTVDVMPSGQRPPNPVELLDSDRMRTLLSQWREQYDHIIIDTPPLVGLSDAMVLAPLADAVLLVARSAKTGRQSLCRARDVLMKVNAPASGVIINDLKLNSTGYYNYYGYYGSKYGEYYHDQAKN